MPTLAVCQLYRDKSVMVCVNYCGLAYVNVWLTQHSAIFLLYHCRHFY